MVDKPKSANSKAIALFLLLGLPVLLVIAGAPFYSSLIQSPERRTEVAITRDVEAIDRAVFNMDPQVAAIKDGLGDAKPEIPEGVIKRKDVYDKSTLTTLQQTSALLRNAVEADQKRKMKSKAATQFTNGPTSISNIDNDFRKQIAAHDQALKEGEAAIRRLPTTNHLWSNRAKAIYQSAQAQLQRSRGDFEGWQARLLCDEVEAQAGPLAEMRRTAASIEAQKPTAAVVVIAKSIEEQTAAQAAMQEVIQKLSGEISKLEAKATGLEAAAAEKRARMTELAGSSTLGGAVGREYLQLSNEARQAEAEATAIRYGTLANAKAADLTFDSMMPKYEGGTPTPGIRDLKARLEEYQQEATIIETRKSELAGQQQAINETIAQFDAQKAEVTKAVDALAESVGQVLAEAEKHAQAAGKAYDDSAKTLATASRSAKAAVGDAKKRTSDAKAPAADERLARVAADRDMEASMHCLTAEIAVQVVLIDSARIGMTEAQAAAKAAGSGEKTAPPAEEIDKLRTDAANQLAEASKAYEQAANLIGGTSAKFTDGSISGKNYVWQVQLGQAAVSLLKSALADKPEDRSAGREAAYKLLTEVVKTREQSPLISAALETLFYLQQTAK